jgi:adenosylcobyric acid synthase
MDTEGRVLGTYIHGLFNNIRLRRAMLNNISSAKSKPQLQEAPSINKDAEYDKLAALIRGSLDMDMIYKIAGLKRDH